MKKCNSESPQKQKSSQFLQYLFAQKPAQRLKRCNSTELGTLQPRAKTLVRTVIQGAPVVARSNSSVLLQRKLLTVRRFTIGKKRITHGQCDTELYRQRDIELYRQIDTTAHGYFDRQDLYEYLRGKSFLEKKCAVIGPWGTEDSLLQHEATKIFTKAKTIMRLFAPAEYVSQSQFLSLCASFTQSFPTKHFSLRKQSHIDSALTLPHKVLY